MILVFANTRAELIKLSPLIKELKKQGKLFFVIGTGQHDLDYLAKGFNISIDKYLTDPPTGSSRFGLSKFKALMWIPTALWKSWRYIIKTKPEYVICHGDTLSAALVAIAGKFSKSKVVHIEAGLRSDRLFEPFPEEIMRRIISKCADLHYCPNGIAYFNLKGIEGRKYVGNTIYDLLKSYNIISTPGDYVVSTIHRQENLKNPERLRMIANTLNFCNREVRLFAHDPLLKALNKYGIKMNDNIKISKLSNHKDFVKVLAGSLFVVADGGSVMEECAFYDKPFIMMRSHTERTILEPYVGASKEIVRDLK